MNKTISPRRTPSTYRLQRVEVAGLADPFALATLDFGIAYETAVLEWFEQLAVMFSDQREGTAGLSM